jgi:hypothetical protein
MTFFMDGFEKRAANGGLPTKSLSMIRNVVRGGAKQTQKAGPKVGGGTIDYSSIHQPHEGMTHAQFLSKTSSEYAHERRFEGRKPRKTSINRPDLSEDGKKPLREGQGPGKGPGEKIAKEEISGGMADGRKDSEYPQDQLRMGRKVELEHTNDPAKANEIAKDHLSEDPKYYTHLKEMEDKYVEKTAFQIGLEKKAGMFHRIGKSRIFLVGNRATNMMSESDMLRRLALRQNLTNALTNVVAKSEGVSKGKVRDMLSEQVRSSGMIIGGTVAGDRSYIGRHFQQESGIPLRDVAHHESFHHVPVVGHSEFLAHAWGGLKSKKGTLSPGQAAKDVGKFLVGRPGRAAIETGVASGLGYGGYKGVQALRNHGTEKTASEVGFEKRSNT